MQVYTRRQECIDIYLQVHVYVYTYICTDVFISVQTEVLSEEANSCAGPVGTAWLSGIVRADIGISTRVCACSPYFRMG